MKELLKDIEKLVFKHKWTILCVIVISYLLIDWSDIKSGFIDGWLNK
jgi:hypothetical protein